ncbi:hypothetical protein [Baekduia sp.]|uniref:hypothetical protein n=1 Tax=Baekduia sp. TaxID=2600305 RepID=UPI002E0A0EDB|nr:hypothetical protein [Baekduia sp.]
MACSILLAVLACAALPGVSEANRKIRGVGFSTSVPSDWKTGKGKNGSTRVYGAASARTKRNVAVNSMQLGITVIPVVDMERKLGRSLPSSLEELLSLVISTPQQAQGVQLTAPIRASTLDGRPAASGAVQFFFNGATILQSTTVAVRRSRVYIVEFDLDLALEYQGLPILGRIHDHWRWR